MKTRASNVFCFFVAFSQAKAGRIFELKSTTLVVEVHNNDDEDVVVVYL